MDIGTLFSLKGRIALVTGGGTGIGRHIAAGLASAGAKVYICGRREDKIIAAASEIAAQTGSQVIGLKADVSTVEGIEALTAALGKQETALHILVNNAGTIVDGTFGDYPEEGWDQVMNLNLKSPFFLMQRLLPLLKAGGTSARPASVINIGSVGALKVGPRENYAYQASKSATHFMAKSYAKHLAKHHITVNVIAPGFFESEMTVITDDAMRTMLENTVPLGRTGTPEDMAGVAIYLTSRAGAYVTGTVIPVEGGMSI